MPETLVVELVKLLLSGRVQSGFRGGQFLDYAPTIELRRKLNDEHQPSAFVSISVLCRQLELRIGGELVSTEVGRAYTSREPLIECAKAIRSRYPRGS